MNANMDKSTNNSVSNVYTILTEEVPEQNEIKFILQNILNIDIYLYNTIDILPVIHNEKFTGEWFIIIDTLHIVIKLFNGESSCVDYMVYNGHVDNNTCAGSAICILESTKTSDTSSRNTSVNQRITKFMVYNRLFPINNTRKIMFYNEEWTSEKITNTGSFGLCLMKSLHIEAFHVKNNHYESLYDKYTITEFQTIDDLIITKNNIKEKHGNVSIKIQNIENDYYISCKLDKGKTTHSGKISHDPNVGLLCGVMNLIHSKNKQCSIIIQHHNISQHYFDKLPKSKFWYAIHGITVIFEHIHNITLPQLPLKYFTIENRNTEKLSTILFSQIVNKKYACIFSNHSGCALSNIKTLNKDKDITVERTMHRPDILFYNSEKNELYIIEGKIEKDIYLGVLQLQTTYLDRFITLITCAYPDCIIKKGLCITIDSIENICKYQHLEYPVVFALDTNGVYFSNL